MKLEQVMPVLIIVISILAAVVYAFRLDFKHTLYWVASAALVYSVTF